MLQALVENVNFVIEATIGAEQRLTIKPFVYRDTIEDLPANESDLIFLRHKGFRVGVDGDGFLFSMCTAASRGNRKLRNWVAEIECQAGALGGFVGR